MAKDLNKTVVYSALEVANICGVVNQTAINWIRNGHLKAFSTPGGQYRVYRDDLIVFMQSRGMRMPDDFMAIVADSEKSQNSIVIVDDDRGLNNVLKMYLEKIFPDIQFFQAFDGFEAGALLMDKKPFCVLLDLNLPGVNGLELCARLKQQEMYSCPYVIVISAIEDTDVEETAKAVGADLFFRKPLYLKDVADSMKAFFESIPEKEEETK